MRVLQDDTPGQVTALAYSPEGTYLAVGSSDGLVRLWYTRSGQLSRTFEHSSAGARITSLAFRPVVGTLTAGTSLAAVHLWETPTGKLIGSLHAGPTDHAPGSATVVQYRPDGMHLVAGQMGLVTDWLTGADKPARVLRPLYAHMVKPVWSLAFGPENALAVGEVNHVQIWQATGNQVRAELDWPEGDVVGLHFLPGQQEVNGARLLVARGREVGLFEVRIGNPWKRLQVLRHPEQLRATALAPDGRRLLTAGDDWTVRVWDTACWQKAAEYNWRLGPVRLLAIAPDGMTAAAVGGNRPGVLIWDLE